MIDFAVSVRRANLRARSIRLQHVTERAQGAK
jgi:hypothetical protein